MYLERTCFVFIFTWSVFVSNEAMEEGVRSLTNGFDKCGSSSACRNEFWEKNRSLFIKKHLLHHQVHQLLTPTPRALPCDILKQRSWSDPSINVTLPHPPPPPPPPPPPSGCNIYSTAGVCEGKNTPASSWFSFLPLNEIYVYFLYRASTKIYMFNEL